MVLVSRKQTYDGHKQNVRGLGKTKNSMYLAAIFDAILTCSMFARSKTVQRQFVFFHVIRGILYCRPKLYKYEKGFVACNLHAAVRISVSIDCNESKLATVNTCCGSLAIAFSSELTTLDPIPIAITFEK